MWKFSHDSGVHVIYMEEFCQLGVDATNKQAREIAYEGPVYISFDIDSFDPAFALGTETPEIGGLTKLVVRQLDNVDNPSSLSVFFWNSIAMPSENKRYVVKLTLSERDELACLVKQGKVAAQRRRHASIMLAVDEGKYGPALSDGEASEQLGVTSRSIERIRTRCVSEGLHTALQRKPRSRKKTQRLDGYAEARLVQLASSEAPSGQARWSLHLLANKLAEHEIVDTVSHETTRRVLKKYHKTLAP